MTPGARLRSAARGHGLWQRAPGAPAASEQPQPIPFDPRPDPPNDPPAPALGQSPWSPVHRPLLWQPEPGSCAGRLDPGQTLLPRRLVDALDGHVWPSASPDALSAYARTCCEHIDIEHLWHHYGPWFARRHQIGPPQLLALCAAKRLLAEHGIPLVVDLQIELLDGLPAFALYAAGVHGRLDDTLWDAVAPLLTTCATMLREPRADAILGEPAARPPLTPGRSIPEGGTQPDTWEVGDWMHTWWGWPLRGDLRERCTCPAHPQP
ncbi:hypothetical protein GCM10022247_35000 [Allokutzneria multivorans]|uniref:Uncharacterized protein n=2 Tax=Allokutzneria multivorans TaxID=1142134 RepID=A0ABP7SCG9_9PSEU